MYDSLLEIQEMDEEAAAELNQRDRAALAFGISVSRTIFLTSSRRPGCMLNSCRPSASSSRV